MQHEGEVSVNGRHNAQERVEVTKLHGEQEHVDPSAMNTRWLRLVGTTQSVPHRNPQYS